MNSILSLGLIFLTGIVINKLIDRFRLPAITGDILLGIIIGQEFLDLIHTDILSSSSFISNIVLGFIAFTIGQNFSLKDFKKIGKPVLFISIFEAAGAWIGVTLIFHLLLKQPLYISLLYGSISSATAPAATVMVVKQYRARGLFTSVLLGVVAIDDAWCLIIFSISFAVAKSLHFHNAGEMIVIKVLIKSIFEIGGALLLGASAGFLLSYFYKFFRSHAEIEIYTLGAVLLSIGAAIPLHFSVLLTAMALGATLVNLKHTQTAFFDILNDIEAPLYLLFFVLAGANLRISELRHIGLVGIVYLFTRVFGKVTGAYIGGIFGNVPAKIRKYIGFGLIPQAGVALGVALIAKEEFPAIGDIIFTTIVTTTIVYELIGPIMTEIGLSKAGEINTGLIGKK